jgi:hypothetical protein
MLYNMDISILYGLLAIDALPWSQGALRAGALDDLVVIPYNQAIYSR